MKLTIALVLLAALLAPLAAAQDVLPGGEPGITVTLDGHDLASAAEPSAAFALDPSQDATISVRLAPPPGTTWDLKSIRVGLVAAGSSAPALLSREAPANTTIPPGFTVFVNRTVALSGLKPLGVGLFQLEARVEDASGTALSTQTFYVRVEGNPFLTVGGVVAAIATVATGYGLWRLIRDAKEIKDARDRHRAKEAESGKLARAAATGLDITNGVAGVLSVIVERDANAAALQKRAPVKWAFTGLGLGGVGLSWAQFLGFVPFDLADTAIWAVGAALVFLLAALLALAWAKRIHASPAR